jgi:3-methyl-2-oxobutanoate hydroxymethyltransferase
MTSRPQPDSAPALPKMPVTELGAMKRRGEKIVVVTAYDAPSGRLADKAGVDCVLVGDSAAMTVLGHESTLPVTLDEMLLLTRAVARATTRAVVVSDMPFGSFQVSDEATVVNAVRLVKEGRADAVKIEGAGPMLSRVEALVGAGIPVMGHVGLTPQSWSSLGGYRAQGRTASAARQVYDDALALERAGCFSVVLEAIPAAVAARVTGRLAIPTIGIGAGPACDGQVLVWHDLLGITPGHVPRFVKPYAQIGDAIGRALEAYAADVRAAAFPADEHTYAMPEDELRRFEQELDR